MRVVIVVEQFRSEVELPNREDEIVLSLIPDGWNDYGLYCTFKLWVIESTGKHSPGDVKILHRSGEHESSTMTEPHLSGEPSKLGRSNFASLGQSVDYYLWFAEHPHGVRLLEALADICVDVSVRAEWSHLYGYDESLLRFSDAQKALEEGPAILAGDEAEVADFSFTFQTHVPGAETPHILNVDFSAEACTLCRMHVLIGANGTGKSTVLHQLAAELSSSSLRDDRFPKTPERRFSRQILVSTSPYDIAKRPALGDRSSFRFVGLRWSFERLRARFLDYVESRDEPWESWLSANLPNHELLGEYLSASPLAPPESHLEMLLSDKQDWSVVLRNVVSKGDLQRLVRDAEGSFHLLSSGQRSILTILLGLAAELDRESLVLLDEPENHLHPRYLEGFLGALDALLEARASFAIVATHSTLVLQSVPARCVSVFERRGAAAIVRAPRFQTFGTAVGALSYDIFGVPLESSRWLATIESLVNAGHTVPELLAMFDPRLEPEAEATIRSLFETD